MTYNIFGWEFKRKKEEPLTPSFVPKDYDDGALVVSNSGYNTAIDLEGTVRSEAELVSRYRDMALHSELDVAIDEIVNETITLEEKEPIKINLEELEVSDKVKKIIISEFKKVLSLLKFNQSGQEIFRRWYVDGRLYFHVIINKENSVDGIKELRYIDPRKIRKIREVSKRRIKNTDPSATNITKVDNEYFLFNDKGFMIGNKIISNPTSGLKISKDSIIHVTSGLTDTSGSTVLSFIHKSIKPLNQLRYIEDAIVIYRLARAPERRVWYVDIGKLPKSKGEQYMADLIAKQKNRLLYDAKSGEIKDTRNFMCFSLDTKIPLLDGRTLELQEIIKEYKLGKINWVYSCDPITGKFIPGPISWAGITKHNSDVVKVTLDNGKSVICTPNHKFPVWNKGFIEAKDLQIGESLIPGYRRKTNITSNGINYEQIYKNDTKTWEFTHREIAKWKKDNNISEEFCYFKEIIDLDNINETNSNTEKLHNHKVVSVEYLKEKTNVGALTIDQNEDFHSHHTYLLDIGVYTKNSMLEDYWIPRREGGRGTEVTTLKGGENLGKIEDVNYFKEKLYESLYVPKNRLDKNNLFGIGSSTEITREELRFGKFIFRLRTKFATLFTEILEKQLVLKQIMSVEEWTEIKDEIRYEFSKDTYFTELKDAEILNQRIMTLNNILPIVGVFYSKEWVKKNILYFNDEQIQEMDEQISLEQMKDVQNQNELHTIANDGFEESEPEGKKEPENPKPNVSYSEPKNKEEKEAPEEIDDKKKLIDAKNTYLRLKRKKSKSKADYSDFQKAAQILAKSRNSFYSSIIHQKGS